MYEDYKMYGPYQGKDGRLRIIGVDSNKKKHTISYPKYLLEIYLGRNLEKDEQVDHIDGNPLNNNLDNLQVLKFKDHQKLDVIRNNDITVQCTYCGKKFTIKGSTIGNRNRPDRHQSGYFCSRECSGKYGKSIQLGILHHNQTERVVSTKFKVKSAHQETDDVEVG